MRGTWTINIRSGRYLLILITKLGKDFTGRITSMTFQMNKIIKNI
jgi:hypothetical protein